MGDPKGSNACRKKVSYVQSVGLHVFALYPSTKAQRTDIPVVKAHVGLTPVNAARYVVEVAQPPISASPG
jgi:ABC-type microcin C transport system duplicated ATPase subunit YejF